MSYSQFNLAAAPTAAPSVTATAAPSVANTRRNEQPRIAHSLAERNRANAQHSSGPRTESGKAISRLNAVKSGLTGRTVVLPSDDAARYEQHVQNWQKELNPQGARECNLVQSVADAYWRSERIVRLEFALYAQGRMEGEGEQHATSGIAAASPENNQPELAAFLRYEKQLRNLSVQEGRIRRQREKDLKELRELQEKRLKQAEAGKLAQTKAAAASTSSGTTNSTNSNPKTTAMNSTLRAEGQPNLATKSGFEFTTSYLHSSFDGKLNLATVEPRQLRS